jgi:hypothetical protein
MHTLIHFDILSFHVISIVRDNWGLHTIKLWIKISSVTTVFSLTSYSGPGAVGNKIPVIAAAIHTIKAITNALIQPIS